MEKDRLFMTWMVRGMSGVKYNGAISRSCATFQASIKVSAIRSIEEVENELSGGNGGSVVREEMMCGGREGSGSGGIWMGVGDVEERERRIEGIVSSSWNTRFVSDKATRVWRREEKREMNC